MRCPACGSYNTTVTDTRRKVIEEKSYIDTVYRRHKCKECGFRFTTYEMYGNDELKMIKTNKKYNQNAIDVPNIKYSRMAKVNYEI